jgi:hypothetical protein
MNQAGNKKGLDIIDKYISKAKKERDTKGYRENLGYDKYNEVKEKIEKLDLSYSETADLMNYFTIQCDSI